MRILVCGGRGYSNKRHLDLVLNSLRDSLGTHDTIEAVIHGGARGVDYMAGAWARRNKIHEEIYLADWNQWGLCAGPIRNQRMIDEGLPSLVIAFPGGRGTADMVSRARRLGIPVNEIPETKY